MVRQAAAPFHFERRARHFLIDGAQGPIGARQAQCVPSDGEFAADDRGVDDIVIVDDGVDAAFRLGGIVQQQAAELVEVGGEIVPVRHPGEVEIVHAVGQQDAVELVEAAECVVGFERHIPAITPPAGEREIALGDDAAAEAVEIALLVGCHIELAAILIDAGELDGILAAGKALAPITHPEHALAGHKARMESEIVRGREGEIIRDLGEVAEISGVAHVGGQEA